jgi:hypothetical protein
MANDEIRVQQSIQVDNEEFQFPKYGGAIEQLAQANPGGGVPGQVNVTTVGVDVDLSALTTLGWCFIVNADDTNFIEWGPYYGAFHAIGKIEPGQKAGPFQLSPGKTLHLRADTASCLAQVFAFEK